MTTQLKTRPKPKAVKTDKNSTLDLIIIGGGPAGLTAALYALRARLKVLLVEKMILGGAASTTFQIENYPGFPEGLSGLELGKRLQEQVNKLNLEILWGDSTRVKDRQVQVDGKTLSAKAIIFLR